MPRRAQGRKGVPSTGRTTCGEHPPPPRPRLLTDTVNHESDEGLSDISLALFSIVAVAFGKKGEHADASGATLGHQGIPPFVLLFLPQTLTVVEGGIPQRPRVETLLSL